jgi:hypothetical protein
MTHTITNIQKTPRHQKNISLIRNRKPHLRRNSDRLAFSQIKNSNHIKNTKNKHNQNFYPQTKSSKQRKNKERKIYQYNKHNKGTTKT